MEICSFSDPQTYKISVDGEIFLFDFGERFGPWAIDKNGREKKNQPKPKHKFWVATTQWYKQGKRVDENGLCVWEPEPDFDYSNFVQIGKRTWVSKSIAEKYGLLT